MERSGRPLTAMHSRLKESADALKSSLKTLENTRTVLSDDPALAELRESIRIAITKAETMIKKQQRKKT